MSTKILLKNRKNPKQTTEHESDGDVIGALGTVTKGLVQGLEDLEITVETIQTKALFRLARLLSRVQKICVLLSLKLQLETTC